MFRILLIAMAAVLLPIGIGLVVLIAANFHEYPPPISVYMMTWLCWCLGIMCVVNATRENPI